MTRAQECSAGGPSIAGLATAIAVALELAVLRVVLDANPSQAFLLGHPLPMACAIRARTGLPCPMCGVTRAVAMTLHGHVTDALVLFPAAPVVSLGLVLLCAALVFDFVLRRRRPGAVYVFQLRLRQGALAYAAFCGALWLVDWTARVGTALARG